MAIVHASIGNYTWNSETRQFSNGNETLQFSNGNETHAHNYPGLYEFLMTIMVIMCFSILVPWLFKILLK